MKRLIMIVLSMILVLVGCGGGGSLRTAVRSPDGLHKHLGSSTVALVMTSESGVVHPFCTGVWVSETEILTAGHCVADEDEDGNPLDVVGYEEHYVIETEVHEFLDTPSAIHLGKVVAVDEVHDLALIRAVKSGVPSHEVASLAGELPGVGEHVYAVGHPKGLYWSHAEGMVSAYRSESNIGAVIQVDATVWYGNSGGGLFDRDGNLIGICSQLTRVPHMNLYVHLDSIKRFMKLDCR
jgi:hypothetical protein